MQHDLDFFPDEAEVLVLNPRGRPCVQIFARAVLGGFVSTFTVMLSSAGTNSAWEQSATRAEAVQQGCKRITEFIDRQRSPETSKREIAQVAEWVASVSKQIMERT